MIYISTASSPREEIRVEDVPNLRCDIVCCRKRGGGTTFGVGYKLSN